jgi:hypothetical protein
MEIFAYDNQQYSRQNQYDTYNELDGECSHFFVVMRLSGQMNPKNSQKSGLGNR